MSSRSSGYSNGEDIILCQPYLEISQDPITRRFRKADRFWACVDEKYNVAKPSNMEYCNSASIRYRMQNLNAAVKKLKACINQVENMHPSGDSDANIVSFSFLYFPLSILYVPHFFLNV